MAKSDAKVRLRGAFNKIATAIKELEIDALPEIAEFVRSRIVAKARTGKTMASGKEESLKPLSPNYIDQRKKLRKSGDKSTDPTFFKPAKSNVTLTGEYLNSVHVRSMDKKKGEFVVGPNDQKHADDDFTNQQLAAYLSKQGRSIYGIDDTTKARIIAILKRDVRNTLKKNLLK